MKITKYQKGKEMKEKENKNIFQFSISVSFWFPTNDSAVKRIKKHTGSVSACSVVPFGCIVCAPELCCQAVRDIPQVGIKRTLS